MSQSNTRKGPFVAIAGEDLTQKENHVLVLTHDTGKPIFKLPTALDDEAEYILLEGAPSGGQISVLPLDRDSNIRVPLVGTCNPGDPLVPGVIATNAGQVRPVPATNGTYYAHFRAEEKGVNKQWVLARWIPTKTIVVSG